ncbi:hypothetical protein BDF14DRAFT_1797241 [Spinellus fusiger]|nr:hypothetical protein BDF14DRAFT_1797241 [Spinellus fusiger]
MANLSLPKPPRILTIRNKTPPTPVSVSVSVSASVSASTQKSVSAQKSVLDIGSDVDIGLGPRPGLRSEYRSTKSKESGLHPPPRASLARNPIPHVQQVFLEEHTKKTLVEDISRETTTKDIHIASTDKCPTLNKQSSPSYAFEKPHLANHSTLETYIKNTPKTQPQQRGSTMSSAEVANALDIKSEISSLQQKINELNEERSEWMKREKEYRKIEHQMLKTIQKTQAQLKQLTLATQAQNSVYQQSQRWATYPPNAHLPTLHRSLSHSTASRSNSYTEEEHIIKEYYGQEFHNEYYHDNSFYEDIPVDTSQYPFREVSWPPSPHYTLKRANMGSQGRPTRRSHSTRRSHHFSVYPAQDIAQDAYLNEQEAFNTPQDQWSPFYPKLPPADHEHYLRPAHYYSEANAYAVDYLAQPTERESQD